MAQTTNIGADGRAAKPNDKAVGASPTRPKLEAPAVRREAAQAPASKAKAAFARMKSATEAASGIFGETFDAAQSHGVAMTLKTVEVVKANADASFDFLKAIIGAKTMAECIEAQTAYATKQFDALNVHVKDVQDAAQKAGQDLVRPSRAAWDGEKGARWT
jgi:hypothetical protein